jgi:uncharacterized membrane protein YfcA
MLEIYFFFLYFFIITTLQSVVGVGILVLGTPFLLILDYNMVEIFFILLPLSIITSFLNFVFLKSINKNFKEISNKELYKFFIVCIPFIVIGLLILKFFQSYINFKYLVSIIIILSVIIVTYKDKVKFKINFFRISILSIVGVVHGLTNSGGALMSLAISTNYKKNLARYNITFFYLILAIAQYFLTVLLFYNDFFVPDLELFVVIILGIMTGNKINNLVSEKKFKLLINFLAISTSTLLILN